MNKGFSHKSEEVLKLELKNNLLTIDILNDLDEYVRSNKSTLQTSKHEKKNYKNESFGFSSENRLYFYEKILLKSNFFIFNKNSKDLKNSSELGKNSEYVKQEIVKNRIELNKYFDISENNLFNKTIEKESEYSLDSTKIRECIETLTIEEIETLVESRIRKLFYYSDTQNKTEFSCIIKKDILRTGVPKRALDLIHVLFRTEYLHPSTKKDCENSFKEENIESKHKNHIVETNLEKSENENKDSLYVEIISGEEININKIDSEENLSINDTKLKYSNNDDVDMSINKKISELSNNEGELDLMNSNICLSKLGSLVKQIEYEHNNQNSQNSQNSAIKPKEIYESLTNRLHEEISKEEFINMPNLTNNSLSQMSNNDYNSYSDKQNEKNQLLRIKKDFVDIIEKYAIVIVDIFGYNYYQGFSEVLFSITLLVLNYDEFTKFYKKIKLSDTCTLYSFFISKLSSIIFMTSRLSELYLKDYLTKDFNFTIIEKLTFNTIEILISFNGLEEVLNINRIKNFLSEGLYFVYPWILTMLQRLVGEHLLFPVWDFLIINHPLMIYLFIGNLILIKLNSFLNDKEFIYNFKKGKLKLNKIDESTNNQNCEDYQEYSEVEINVYDFYKYMQNYVLSDNDEYERILCECMINKSNFIEKILTMVDADGKLNSIENTDFYFKNHVIKNILVERDKKANNSKNLVSKTIKFIGNLFK